MGEPKLTQQGLDPRSTGYPAGTAKARWQKPRLCPEEGPMAGEGAGRPRPGSFLSLRHAPSRMCLAGVG